MFRSSESAFLSNAESFPAAEKTYRQQQLRKGNRYEPGAHYRYKGDGL